MALDKTLRAAQLKAEVHAAVEHRATQLLTALGLGLPSLLLLAAAAAHPPRQRHVRGMSTVDNELAVNVDQDAEFQP